MTTPSGNPFVFPGMGLGQNPEHLAGNPLLQSFEMMRNAWTSMGSQMLSGGIPTPPILNIEELDRRINELRAVENWLRLNLTMLQGSIQAMEVQRATIATLQSFASMGGATPSAAAPGGQQPSPLEVALGMKGSSQPTREQDNASDQNKQAAPPAGGDSAQSGDSSQAAAGASGAAASGAGASAPHQAWWNMLQNQFNQLASAAAATLTPDTSGATPGASPADRAPSSAAPAPAKAARKAARPAARKSAPRKS